MQGSLSQTEIAKAIGMPQQTVNEWIIEKRKNLDSDNPPESRQHFDVWSFQNADKDAGQQSYFGGLGTNVEQDAMPGQAAWSRTMIESIPDDGNGSSTGINGPS
jgi:hypothetical protein